MSFIKSKNRLESNSGKQKIFEEFYQIEPPNTRHDGGLGTGLTIAKGLIEAQDGKIWAESEGTGASSFD